ncbi:MAG: VWD domain-containing protein [Scytolyngbya sp. HA4215-MV1]|jgi:hypothetical protein|nr:VWD domain-containing protein [Scytolyngbya sp. HA4215-MV1]
MRSLRSIALALATFLFIVSAAFWRKAIAILLSSIHKVNKFTREIRFWLLGILSFIIATVATVFVSGSFLNRLLLAASCTIFSFNSAFCTQNLGLESDPVIATGISNFEKTRDAYVYDNSFNQQQGSSNIKDNVFLAFKSPEVHNDVDGSAIRGTNMKFNWAINADKDIKNPIESPICVNAKSLASCIQSNKDESSLTFTESAITEINNENISTDLGAKLGGNHDGIFTSTEFDKPWAHCDNELLGHCSYRLVAFKKLIIEKIKKVKDANKEANIGQESRIILGAALHTLQDFYSHSNWFEMGNRDINQHLGRSLLCYKPKSIPVNFYPTYFSQSDFSTLSTFNTDFLAGVVNLSDTNCSLPPRCNVDACTNASPRDSRQAPEEPSLSNPKDPKWEKWNQWQTAESKWVGESLDAIHIYDTRNLRPGLNKLTSGYWIGTGPNDSCIAPKGKVRHGLGLFGCPGGLNKDDPERTGFNQARELAIIATRNYIDQILYDPQVISNVHAVRVLMGLREPALKDAPCNQPINQSKSDNEQDKNQCSIPGHSSNDPHLTTFDGFKYDLQTLGEFTLVKSSHSDFEVQARQTPWNSSGSLAINSAIAIKVGSDRVAFYAQGLPDADTSTPLRVNGKPTTIKGNKLALQGGGEILTQGGTYVVSAPTGEKVLVSPSGSFLNTSPVVDNRAGKYSGLLGNVNGNPKDDLQSRGGKNVLEVRSTYGDVKQVLNLVGLRAPGVLDRAEQVYFDQLYKQFANSWRVKPEESLFDYPPGKTTQSYTNPGFPDKYLTLNMLSADQIQKAQNACTEAKVTPDLMEGCIFDVGFSGFSEFARATAEINGYIGIVNHLFPGLNIPTPEQAVDRVIEKVKPKVCLPIVGCV